MSQWKEVLFLEMMITFDMMADTSDTSDNEEAAAETESQVGTLGNWGLSGNSSHEHTRRENLFSKIKHVVKQQMINIQIIKAYRSYIQLWFVVLPLISVDKLPQNKYKPINANTDSSLRYLTFHQEINVYL